ncbi:MAG: alpha/beta hydrolase [Pseudomonadota bacterium]|jgi:acetyl esterase
MTAPFVSPDAAQLLAMLAAQAGPKLRDIPPADGRAMYVALAQMADPPPVDCPTAEIAIPGPAGAIPGRLYGDTASHGPLIVFFHGGGWVIGDLATHDSFCRHVAASLGLRVLAVDYRLAPEHAFPAAYDDCLATFNWARSGPTELGPKPTKLGVAGDSAGGNLAAAVALATRAGGGPDAQLLLYPAVDMVGRTASYEQFSQGYMLDADTMDYFGGCYLPDGVDRADPSCSPLLAADHAGAAPAVVVTCGLDPLRDEGRAYAGKLIAAGVNVRYAELPGLIHGVINMRQALPSAVAPLDAALRAFAELLA